MKKLITLLCLSFISVHLSAQFDALYQQGMQQQKAGKYYPAIKSYTAAIGFANDKSKIAKAHRRIQTCENNLMKVYKPIREKNKTIRKPIEVNYDMTILKQSKSISSLLKSIKTIDYEKQIAPDDESRLVHINNQIELYELYIELQRKNNPKLKLVTLYYNSILLEENIDTKIELSEKAIALIESFYNSSPKHKYTNQLYINLLGNLGWNKMLAADFKSSITFSRKALLLAQKDYNAERAIYASVFINLAHAYLLDNQEANAIAYYNQWKKQYKEENKDETNDDIQEKMIRIFDNDVLYIKKTNLEGTERFAAMKTQLFK